MRSKPRFHKQETTYSCVPACLRIVLSSFDIAIPEAELRDRCDCTPFGTEALKAVDVARALGFSNTIKATLNFDELVEQLEAGYYPIILVNLLPIDGIKDAHAIVSLEAKPNYVKVYDPLKGERILPTSTLMTAWTMMSNLTILVIP
jgi:ABC-type bacteriocin/lantibiotic exporter with double-glycine peptidase domain